MFWKCRDKFEFHLIIVSSSKYQMQSIASVIWDQFNPFNRTTIIGWQILDAWCQPVMSQPGVDFTKLFSPSKNSKINSFLQKNCSSILPYSWTKFVILACQICKLKFVNYVPCCQFHQQFICAFLVQKSFLCLEFGFERTFVRKMRT